MLEMFCCGTKVVDDGLSDGMGFAPRRPKIANEFIFSLIFEIRSGRSIGVVLCSFVPGPLGVSEMTADGPKNAFEVWASANRCLAYSVISAPSK